MELTAVLANHAPVGASWRVLWSYRGSLEGGDVVVGRLAAAVGRFEGAVNGAFVRGTVAVVAMSCPHALQQHRGCRHSTRAWRCSGGDGRTGLTSTGKTAPAGLTSRRSPV
jgi:hypothetical protein